MSPVERPARRLAPAGPWRRLPFLLVLLGIPLGVLGAWAEEDPVPAPGASRGGVDLDRLLKLPSSLDYGFETRGGRTPGEWRARFKEIEDALQTERKGLAEAEQQLTEVAASSDAWQVAPALPGVQPTNEAPLDFGLRQRIRRHREEITRLERKLRDLEVEADLAGVPEEWRG